MSMAPLCRPAPGCWFLHDPFHPDWCCGGNAKEIWTLACPPNECLEALDKLIAKHGRPPMNLKYGCIKFKDFADCDPEKEGKSSLPREIIVPILEHHGFVPKGATFQVTADLKA